MHTKGNSKDLMHFKVKFACISRDLSKCGQPPVGITSSYLAMEYSGPEKYRKCFFCAYIAYPERIASV